MAVPCPAPRGGQGLGQGRVDPGLPVTFPACLIDAKGEVGPREAAHVLGRVGGQAEPLEDLVAHHGRGRGGAGQEASLGQQGQELADLHVLGAEVVAPLADAVGLVDGHERALETSHELTEAIEGEPLRGHVGELVAAPGQGSHAPADLVAVESAGQVGGGHAPGLEGGHLVVHQGDEGGDDQGRARKEGGGELVGEALAAAGGRHEQHAPHVEQGLHGLPLAGPEGGESEALQSGVEIDGHHRFEGRPALAAAQAGGTRPPETSRPERREWR